MMKSFIQRIETSRVVGKILIGAAIFGWLLSLAGMIVLWSFKPVVTKTTDTLLSSGLDVLTATSSLLVVADDSLNAASDNLTLVSDIIYQVAETLDKTTPIVESVSDLVGNNLTKAISDMQNALTTLQSTAKIVDSTLGFLSKIPFVSSEPYEPDVPLEGSVSKMSEGMKDLPDQLTTIQTDMQTASESMIGLPATINNLAVELDKINTNIDSALKVINQYKTIVDTLIVQITWLQKALPVIMVVIWIFFSLIFVWMASAQLGLFTQGLERLHRNP
jgi:methyl-accepting chemotaxis protein